jgi:transcriptional regulator with XRE-family HTH domain
VTVERRDKSARSGRLSRDPVETLHAFGERLRDLREAAGLTQEALAEAAGVHWVTISRIETGVREVGVTTVVDLAAALGLDPSELLTFQIGSVAALRPMSD